MFRPKLPDTPHVPSITTHIPQDHAPAPSAGRSVAPFVGVGAGAVPASSITSITFSVLLRNGSRLWIWKMKPTFSSRKRRRSRLSQR